MRWSYYINFIESPYHKYGLELRVETERMKKYGVTSIKPPVPPLYDTLYLLKNGGVIVDLNGLQGLYHLDKGQLLPSIYKKVYLADKHCVFVQTQQKKWGIVNWNGEVLLPFEFDQIKKKNVKNVSLIEGIKENKKSYYNYAGEEIEPYKKDFSFTQTIKGKVQSMIGYDVYADFADSYELHKEVKADNFIYTKNDSLFSIAVLGKINQLRLEQKLPPFLLSKAMYYAANHHANDMVKYQFYGSKSTLWYKESVENRIQIEGGNGYGYTEVLHKEVLAEGLNYKEYLQKVLDKQLHNKTIKQKLLSTKYRYFTCGVTYDHSSKNIYLVYNFAEDIEDKKVNPVTFKWTDYMFDDYTYESFALLPEIHKKIDMDNMNYDLLNAAIFYETNRQRVLNGGTRYLHSPKLEEAALMHSKDMIEHHFFDHQSPLAGKKSVGDRYRVVGVKCSGGWGENIHMRMPIRNYTYFEIAKSALNSWMNSPGHRANILNEGFKFIGCGGYVNPETSYFKSTQNFTYKDLTYREPEKEVKKNTPKKKSKKKKRRK